MAGSEEGFEGIKGDTYWIQRQIESNIKLIDSEYFRMKFKKWLPEVIDMVDIPKLDPEIDKDGNGQIDAPQVPNIKPKGDIPTTKKDSINKELIKYYWYSTIVGFISVSLTFLILTLSNTIDWMAFLLLEIGSANTLIFGALSKLYKKLIEVFEKL